MCLCVDEDIHSDNYCPSPGRQLLGVTEDMIKQVPRNPFLILKLLMALEIPKTDVQSTTWVLINCQPTIDLLGAETHRHHHTHHPNSESKAASSV